MAEIQKIQNLRSSSPSVALGTLAKAPTSLLAGQIAINDISTDPTIFIKDSTGAIIEFKGRAFVEGLVNGLAGGTMLTDVGYRNVLEVATTLKTFLTGTNDADVVINKWTELQGFLNAIPDSATTLIDMFAGLAGNGLAQTTTTAGDGTKSVKLAVTNSNDSLTVDATGVKVNTVNTLTSTSTTQPLSAAQGKALNDGKVPNARNVVAGAGLTGGGSLSADVTLNVVSANAGITANADNIQLNTVDAYTDTSTVKPLSAARGKDLNDRVVPFENAFTFTGTGTTEDPYKVKVNYSLYSVGEIAAYSDGTTGGGTGGGASALYECSDTAIDSYNSGTTASKVLAAGDVLIYDGSHWRNVANTTSLVSGLDAIITELRRLASGSNAGLMSTSQYTKLGNIGNVVSAVGAVTTSASNNTVSITVRDSANGTDSTTTLTFPVATTSLAGLLSAADKTKLDGIATGATNYTHPNSGVTAGTYKSVTVNAAGHVTAGTNPTTLAGYGITDAAASSHVGATGAAHGNATTSVAGFMSSTDKTKLDGVASGANNYAHPTSGATAGTYKSVTVDANGHVTAGTNPTTLAGYGITDAAASSHVGATGSAHGVATTSINGFMSSTDKTKLDGVATGAEVNQNAFSSISVVNNGAAAVVLDADSKTDTFNISTDASIVATATAASDTLALAHSTADGYKHIPSGGAAGNLLLYSAAGTAQWTSVIDCGTF